MPETQPPLSAEAPCVVATRNDACTHLDVYPPWCPAKVARRSVTNRFRPWERKSARRMLRDFVRASPSHLVDPIVLVSSDLRDCATPMRVRVAEGLSVALQVLGEDGDPILAEDVTMESVAAAAAERGWVLYACQLGGCRQPEVAWWMARTWIDSCFRAMGLEVAPAFVVPARVQMF